jgi:hypothetical protein
MKTQVKAGYSSLFPRPIFLFRRRVLFSLKKEKGGFLLQWSLLARREVSGVV